MILFKTPDGKNDCCVNEDKIIVVEKRIGPGTSIGSRIHLEGGGTVEVYAEPSEVYAKMKGEYANKWMAHLQKGGKEYVEKMKKTPMLVLKSIDDGGDCCVVAGMVVGVSLHPGSFQFSKVYLENGNTILVHGSPLEIWQKIRTTLAGEK